MNGSEPVRQDWYVMACSMRGIVCSAGLVFTMAGFGHPTEHIPPAFNIFGPQVSFTVPGLSCGWRIPSHPASGA